jgi:hypothetical protein
MTPVIPTPPITAGARTLTVAVKVTGVMLTMAGFRELVTVTLVAAANGVNELIGDVLVAKSVSPE